MLRLVESYAVASQRSSSAHSSCIGSAPSRVTHACCLTSRNVMRCPGSFASMPLTRSHADCHSRYSSLLCCDAGGRGREGKVSGWVTMSWYSWCGLVEWKGSVWNRQ